MAESRKVEKTDEKTIASKGLNIVLAGAGAILVVLLVGAVILMGSLLRQFTARSGAGGQEDLSEYKLGTLLIRETPTDTDVLLPHTNSGIVKDISQTVIRASVILRSYGENDNPYPDIECFGIIMDDSGYIITSAAVVRDESLIEAELYDGRRFQARVVGYDLKTDLCILKVQGRNLRTASFGSGGMSEGDGIVYIGLGQRGIINISQGIAGATAGRYLETAAGYSYLKLTATDIVCSDICMGGVVINSHGQIVGFRCSIADDNKNMTYALSVDDVESIIDSLVKNGYVTGRYTSGLGLEAVSDVMAKARNWPKGVTVTGFDYYIYRNDTEMEPGDIIVKVGDISVETVEEFERVLKLQQSEVTISVYRPSEKKYFELLITLAEDTGLYIH